MRGSEFDETAFFRAIGDSGARVLLIGRRALVAWGLPVLTADYDVWLHPDDIDALNAALSPFDFVPSKTADQARALGRYVLENDERVDVFVARRVPTVDGQPVVFDDVFSRRVLLEYDAAVTIAVPALEDLILTKRWASRDKDIADVRLLEALRDRLARKEPDDG